ncbi:lipase maturation factor 2 [Salmo salar]|uniref:Lipase maturation factor n=1 Tax=Salmo salar TaxID=8030 RepID=A0A1S3MZG7_SALSA|nr:lipase maturation factor 2-like [Salmo salar]|eukprot:XP_014008609.1 PREDICTED: lipase maturation factor 2-like [Salmo salar]
MGVTKLTRHMFLWSMANIYMFAFASLYVQIPGLYGNEGVLPVRLVEPRVDGSRPVLEQIHAHPSLLWLGPRLGLDLDAQQAMELLCLVGVLLALGAALLEPLRDSLVFFCLWALYLSLCQMGQDFLRFQWDSLLLEAGFLTVLVAPLNLLRCSAFRQHDAVTFWLARWLLFRLTFGSGVAKLASHCPSWWGLTAVNHMFEAQGIPLPWSWFIQQLPDWYLKLGTVCLLVTEIAVPPLYFAPIRSLRLAAFYIQATYQVKLMFLGNYGFLPFLSLALTFSLLDDDHISYWLGHGKKKSTKTLPQTIMSLLVVLAVFAVIIYGTKVLFTLEIDWDAKTITSETAFTQQQFGNVLKLVTGPTIWVGVLSLTWEVVAAMLGCVCVRGCLWKLWGLVQWAVFASAAVAMFAISVVPYSSMEQVYSSKILPEVRQAYSLVERYRLVSAYSLDSRMTGVDGRSEVILEGSMDKNTWTEIEFMYKPGNVSVAPPVVAPHQPRLDWQMSQVAQGLAKQSPWFTSLVHCLLQGNKDVVRLIQTDSAQYPFSQVPPVYLRASLYRYWFTQTTQDGSSPNEWWRRHYAEEFYPAVHLGDPTLESMLSQHGLKEKFPIQPSPDSPLAQVLRQVRGHVQTLPGHLVLWSLLATVATIWLLKTLLSGILGGRKAKPTPAEPKAKKAKDQPAEKSASASSLKAERENSEENRRDADKSPKKRK